jgi:large subunit ribosomal protein L4
VHGPQPRSYAYRLPRKIFLGALRSALSEKLAGQKLTVVDAWQLESHKTKAFRQVLERLDGDTKTILLIEAAANRNLELASRNLEGVKLVAPRALQPYDMLRHDRLMLSKEAAARLGSSLSQGAASAAPASETEMPAPEQPAEARTAPKRAKKKAAKKPAAKPKRKTKK